VITLTAAQLLVSAKPKTPAFLISPVVTGGAPLLLTGVQLESK
jgi:hypothetical protein